MAERVLITGGAGFIGARLARQLLDRGRTVRILDNLHPQVHGPEVALPPSLTEECELHVGDIRDPAAVGRAVADVDSAVHLAAETGTGQSMYAVHRYSDVNVGGTAVLLEHMARQAGRIGKLVVASSRAVYGEGKYVCARCGVVYPRARTAAALAAGQWEPVCPGCGLRIEAVATDEESRTVPTSIYGASKMSQELLATAFGPAVETAVVTLRYQNVYGAGQSLSNPYTGILTHFFSAIRRGESPRVFEDGRESRDFVHVSDVVRATVAALDYPGSGVFNVGTGVQTTIMALAQAMCRQAGATVLPKVVGDYRVGDIRHCFADFSRAQRELAYVPQVDLESGLREFLDWADAQPAERRRVDEANRELLAHGLLRSGRDG